MIDDITFDEQEGHHLFQCDVVAGCIDLVLKDQLKIHLGSEIKICEGTVCLLLRACTGQDQILKADLYLPFVDYALYCMYLVA